MLRCTRSSVLVPTWRSSHPGGTCPAGHGREATNQVGTCVDQSAPTSTGGIFAALSKVTPPTSLQKKGRECSIHLHPSFRPQGQCYVQRLCWQSHLSLIVIASNYSLLQDRCLCHHKPNPLNDFPRSCELLRSCYSSLKCIACADTTNPLSSACTVGPFVFWILC